MFLVSSLPCNLSPLESAIDELVLDLVRPSLLKSSLSDVPSRSNSSCSSDLSNHPKHSESAKVAWFSRPLVPSSCSVWIFPFCDPPAFSSLPLLILVEDDPLYSVSPTFFAIIQSLSLRWGAFLAQAGTTNVLVAYSSLSKSSNTLSRPKAM